MSPEPVVGVVGALLELTRGKDQALAGEGRRERVAASRREGGPRPGGRERFGALSPARRDRVEEALRERLLAVRRAGFGRRSRRRGFAVAGRAHSSSLAREVLVGQGWAGSSCT